MYKRFTSTLEIKIRENVISNEIIPSEQKGNSANSKDCIDQLLIDKVISVAWIEYKKSFDLLPNS